MNKNHIVIAIAAVVILCSFFIYAYAHWPMTPLSASTKADLIIVIKSKRKLILFNKNKHIKEYTISLGDQPIGKKLKEGDEKTPEGKYKIDFRKTDSVAHLALHISYPDKNDIVAAKARGESPGGSIMIHGLPNRLGYIGRFHRFDDWTNGCIGVTNPEIEEIFRVVADGTPIEIRP